MATTDDLRPWQIAFRLHRAGLYLDNKAVIPGGAGIVLAWYKHPRSEGTGATIEATYAEVGR